jgi:hypothetical protein
MAGVTSRNLDTPDETRAPDKSLIQIASLGSAKVGRATFQPGWKWSECIKPVVGGESCQVHHLGVMTGGTLHVVHNDGSEADLTAGEVYEIQPGHDAWVVGDEAVVAYEFDAGAVATYAQSGGD